MKIGRTVLIRSLVILEFWVFIDVNIVFSFYKF